MGIGAKPTTKLLYRNIGYASYSPLKKVMSRLNIADAIELTYLVALFALVVGVNIVLGISVVESILVSIFGLSISMCFTHPFNLDDMLSIETSSVVLIGTYQNLRKAMAAGILEESEAQTYWDYANKDKQLNLELFTLTEQLIETIQTVEEPDVDIMQDLRTTVAIRQTATEEVNALTPTNGQS